MLLARAARLHPSRVRLAPLSIMVLLLLLGCGDQAVDSACEGLEPGATLIRVRFAEAVVPYSAPCQSETQVATCRNGRLGEWSGSWVHDACEVAEPRACDAAPHGEIEERTRYAVSSVPFGSTCESEVQIRSCFDGAWTSWDGTYASIDCTVGPPADCDGGTHGATQERTAWATSSVPYGQACVGEAQSRTCFDGVWSAWSGTLTEASCSPELPLDCDGEPHGTVQERTRYRYEVVHTGGVCEGEVGQRTCENGTWTDWTGAWNHAACEVRDPTPGEIDLAFADRGAMMLSDWQRRGYAARILELASDRLIAVWDESGGGSSLLGLARFDASGDLDPSFGQDGIHLRDRPAANGSNWFVDASDRPLLPYSLGDDHGVLRLLPSGETDTSFDADRFLEPLTDPVAGYWWLRIATAEPLPSGQTLVVGRIDLYSGGVSQRTDLAFARLNADGSLDELFGVDGLQTHEITFGSEDIRDVLVFADGSFVILRGSGILQRFDSDGLLDVDFGTGGKADFGPMVFLDGFRHLLLDPDGSIVLAGAENYPGRNESYMVIASVGADGAGASIPIWKYFGAFSHPRLSAATDGAGTFLLASTTGGSLSLWSVNKRGEPAGFGWSVQTFYGLQPYTGLDVAYTPDRSRIMVLFSALEAGAGDPLTFMGRVFNTVP